jgi:hypothetical protein
MRISPVEVEADEFMRRFLLHVLPGGFHRIRHYGLLANGNRTASLARIRELLLQEADADALVPGHGQALRFQTRALQRLVILPIQHHIAVRAAKHHFGHPYLEADAL